MSIANDFHNDHSILMSDSNCYLPGYNFAKNCGLDCSIVERIFSVLWVFFFIVWQRVWDTKGNVQVHNDARGRKRESFINLAYAT